jgi:heme/copper-type cytochrome/quinol oxidase subunit 1
MYIVGIDLDRRAYFTRATMIIAVPTGVKIYSWMLTLFGVRLKIVPVVMWMIGFLVLFTIGGLTGVILASARLDVLLHDS